MRKGSLDALEARAMNENLRTGGVRMKALLLSGKIPLRGGVFFDLYNGNAMVGRCGAIRTTQDNNLYYVTVMEEV